MVICALALIGIAGVGFGIASKMWFVSSSANGEFNVGLVAAEMCLPNGCRQVAASAFDLSQSGARYGLAVLAAGVVAALATSAAAGRALYRRTSGRGLAKFALATSVFAIVIAGVWMLIAPWSETMKPSMGAVSFFVGAAILAATAAVPLGGLRSGR